VSRLYAWLVDHGWAVIAVVAVVTLGLAVPIVWLETNVDFTTYVNHEDPAYLLMENAEARYGSQSLIMVVIIHPDGVFNPTTLGKIEVLERRLAGVPGVDEVDGPLGRDVITSSASALEIGPAAPGGRAPTAPEEIAAYRARLLGNETMRGLLIAEDGTAAAILVRLDADAGAYEVSKAIRAVVDEVATPPERFSISGEPYMLLTLTESIQGDLGVLIPIVLVAMCLVLFLSFRSLWGVVVPLLVVGLSVVWTFGPMALFGVRVSIITFVLPVLLLAIGIAYGIHVLNRYNEEILAGKPKRTALIDAMTGITGAVAMAGLTTAGGFLALLTAYLPLIAQFGFFAAIGVGIAMLFALVLLPALFSVLPPPKPRTVARSGGDGRLPRVLGGVTGTVAAHPRFFLVALAVVIAGLAATVPLLKTDSSMSAFLGETHPAVVGMTDIDAHLSGGEQLMIEIDTGKKDGLKDPGLLRDIVDLETYLRSLGVRKTTSITDLVRELNLRFHDDDPAYYAIPDERKQVSQLLFLFSFQGGDLGSVALADYSAGEIVGFYPRADGAEKGRLVREIRTYLAAHFTDDVTVEMVGPTQYFDTMGRQLISSEISSLVTSAIVAAVIVSILMGSLIAGLIGIIPLSLTILVLFAVMAASGTTLNLATATIASVTIGIGIDYAIHFLFRYRREFGSAGSATAAAAHTARTAGRAIVFNAAAVLAGFLVLLVSRFTAFRSFGGLLALAMATSAIGALTVIPVVLVVVRPGFVSTRAWGWLRDRMEKKRKNERHGKNKE